MPSSPSKPSRLYWLLQILGWLAYGTIGFLTNLRFNAAVPPFKIAAMAFTGAALLFLLTHALRHRARKNDWVRLGFGKLILRLVGSTLLIAILSQSFLSMLMFWPLNIVTEEQPYSFGFLLIYIFQTQIILLLWSFAYFSYQAIRNYKQEEIEKWRLQAAVKDAELIALKAQINPHFIFNCLNNIRALVIEDSDKAREAITQLSDLLRRSIQQNQSETTSIESEIATVKDYLALEAIHMEKRLQYSITVDPALSQMEIPSMSIQLLVENAIKHGLSIRPEGGQLDVNVASEDGSLRIQVSNTGQVAEAETSTDSTGIGLKNIRERLELLHGADATISLGNASKTTALAEISIPFSKAYSPKSSLATDSNSSRVSL